MQTDRVIIRPQMRANMQGALVRDENGVIRELPVELPKGGQAQALNRIGNVARQMCGIMVELGCPAKEAEAHARAIEADLALLREML